MRIDIKGYLEHNHLTIYKVAKKSGYGYTTLHKSFNLRDLHALAATQEVAMWQILKELEEHYLKD